MIADPEVDVGDVFEAVPLVEALGAKVLAEDRELEGVGIPGAGFADRPFDQCRSEAAPGHAWGTVQLADEDRAIGARLGSLHEGVAAHDEAIGRELAVDLRHLDERRRIGQVFEISFGRSVFAEKGGEVLRPVEMSERGDEAPGGKLRQRFGIGRGGGTQPVQSVRSMQSENASET